MDAYPISPQVAARREAIAISKAIELSLQQEQGECARPRRPASANAWPCSSLPNLALIHARNPSLQPTVKTALCDSFVPRPPRALAGESEYPMAELSVWEEYEGLEYRARNTRMTEEECVPRPPLRVATRLLSRNLSTCSLIL